MLGGSIAQYNSIRHTWRIKIHQYEKINYPKCNCNDYACLYIYQPAA